MFFLSLGLDDLGNLGVMPLFNFTEKRAKCGVVGKEGEGGEEGLVRECQYKQKFSHEEEVCFSYYLFYFIYFQSFILLEMNIHYYILLFRKHPQGFIQLFSMIL